MLSAFHEVVTGRAPETLRAYLLAVLVQMIAVNALFEVGNLQAPYARFFGLVTALGGFALGLGMVLAMGCAGSVISRAGEGRLDYLAATIALAISAWLTDAWLAAPIRRLLGGEGIPLALPRALGMDRWVAVAAIAVAAALWLMRGRRRRLPTEGWDWTRTGIALGVVGLIAWLASALLGRPAGLGLVQGNRNWAALIFARDLSGLDLNLFLVAGIPLGSYLAARRRGRSLKSPLRSARIPHALAGGALMGFGATLANGDNILHGLSGVPILAVSSIVVMICIFAGVWVGIKLKWLAA